MGISYCHGQFHVIFFVLIFESLWYFLVKLVLMKHLSACVVSVLLFALNYSLAYFHNLTETCFFPEELPEFLVFSKWRYEHIYMLHI